MTEWDKLNRLTPPARFETPDPTSALLRELGIEHPTLQDWLEFNGVEDVLDADLLNALPSEFCDEYATLVRQRRQAAGHSD